MMSTNSQGSQPSGTWISTWALNSRSPDIGALRHSLLNSSTFTPLAASAADICLTIPGRSGPTISNAIMRSSST